jgi:hypothetical protein
MLSPCMSSDVGTDIPKPLSLSLTLHKKSGKKRGKKNCPTENNSGTRVPPKIIKMLEFRNFGIPFDIGITVDKHFRNIKGRHRKKQNKHPHPPTLLTFTSTHWVHWFLSCLTRSRTDEPLDPLDFILFLPAEPSVYETFRSLRLTV